MLRKNLTTVFLTLGSALSASMIYAVTPPPVTGPFVTIPNYKPGFELSVTALALQPGASNLNYVIFNKELPAQSPTWAEHEIDPSFGAAFGLDVGYMFAEGKKINLDWTHLDTSTSANTNAPDASYFLGPDYEIGPNAIPIRNAHGTAQFNYDVVNLNFEQFVDIGKHVNMGFFGGLSNAYLREQVTATYTGNVLTGSFPGPFSTRQQVNSNFSGIGPRFGVEASYTTDNNIGFLGEAAVSALIGWMHSKTTYLSSAQELMSVYGQSSNSQFIKDQSVSQVIPGLDTKLGVSYKYMFNCGTLLTVKAGYEAAVYFNAISQYIPQTLVTPLDTGGIFVATMSHTLSNYSVQGPFVEAVVNL